MIVMGGIIGSGIFINPHVVARELRQPLPILAAWALGGRRAPGRLHLCGAGGAAAGGRRPIRVPARRLPSAGGVPLRLGPAAGHPDRRHGRGGPDLRALRSASSLGAPASEWPLAMAAPPRVSRSINCLGVRAGEHVQSVLMVLKIGAIGGPDRVRPALCAPAPGRAPRSPTGRPPSTSCGLRRGHGPRALRLRRMADRELRGRRAEGSRARSSRAALLFGVGASWSSTWRELGVRARARRPRPGARPPPPRPRSCGSPSGQRGRAAHRGGIAISTLGFLSQSMLTAPRVYYAMARDRLFFQRVGRLTRARARRCSPSRCRARGAVLIALGPLRADTRLRDRPWTSSSSA